VLRYSCRAPFDLGWMKWNLQFINKFFHFLDAELSRRLSRNWWYGFVSAVGANACGTLLEGAHWIASFGKLLYRQLRGISIQQNRKPIRQWRARIRFSGSKKPLTGQPCCLCSL